MNRFAVLCVNVTTAIAFSIAATTCIFAAPQDAEKPVSHVDRKLPAPQRYLVTVARYRLERLYTAEPENTKNLTTLKPADFTSDKIYAAIKAQNASPFETTMLSATTGNPSRVSFGREVSVTVGKTITRQGETNRIEARSIGTVLDLMLTPDKDKMKAEITFSASRVSSERTEDTPPDTTNTSIETSQIFEIGKPTLIAASTDSIAGKAGGASNFVFLTIARQ